LWIYHELLEANGVRKEREQGGSRRKKRRILYELSWDI